LVADQSLQALVDTLTALEARTFFLLAQDAGGGNSTTSLLDCILLHTQGLHLQGPENLKT
jgi:hypothetical protein